MRPQAAGPPPGTGLFGASKPAPVDGLVETWNRAPIGFQYGSNRAPIGVKGLNDFWVTSCFFYVFVGFQRILIIPEWLIKVPGHIAILFISFLELPQIRDLLDP